MKYNKEELISIFQFYDKESTGQVELDIFNYILGNLAEQPLTSNQLKQINSMENHTGPVDYNRYLDNLLKN